MIYQTDPVFPSVIQHYGCYLMSLYERLSTEYSYPFDPTSIMKIFNDGQVKGIIDSDCTIRNPQAFCDMIVGYGKVAFVGKTDPFYAPLENDLEILCFHKDGASFNHFCSGDGHGLVHYDPWSVQGSDSVRNGSVIGKRIFRIV